MRGSCGPFSLWWTDYRGPALLAPHQPLHQPPTLRSLVGEEPDAFHRGPVDPLHPQSRGLEAHEEQPRGEGVG